MKKVRTIRMRLKNYRNWFQTACLSRSAAVFLCWFVICCPTAWAGKNGVKIQTGEWEVSIAVDSDRILIREPFMVRMEWHNITPKTQRLAGRIGTISLRREGWEKQYKLFVSEREETSDTAFGSWVEPGARETRECWLLLGASSGGSGSPKWEFLFDTPGKYQIVFPQFQNASLDVEVTAPASPEDAAACKKFSVSAASLFLGETTKDVVKEGSSDLKAICQHFAGSRYAPYAAWAMAETMWRTEGGSKVNMDEYKRYLDLIIERKLEHKMKDEALFLLARGYAFQKGKKQEIVKIMDRLSKEHPASPCIKKMESSFGPIFTLGTNLPSAKAAPIVSQLKPATLQVDGADKIPVEPRAILESYWKALAELRLNDAEKYLHSDFMGSQDGRRVWRLHWEASWTRIQLDAMQVAVTRADSVASFALPESLMAKGKVWTGEVCVVASQSRYSMTDRASGTKMIARPNQPAITALMKEGDAWKILSDYTEPTRNEIAGRLAQELSASFTRSLTTVRMRSGDDTVLVVDKIRAIIPNINKESNLVWRKAGFEMTGENYDQPVFSGEIREGNEKNEEMAQTSISRVKIMTKLLGDELVLVGVEVDPAKAASPR